VVVLHFFHLKIVPYLVCMFERSDFIVVVFCLTFALAAVSY